MSCLRSFAGSIRKCSRACVCVRVYLRLPLHQEDCAPARWQQCGWDVLSLRDRPLFYGPACHGVALNLPVIMRDVLFGHTREEPGWYGISKWNRTLNCDTQGDKHSLLVFSPFIIVEMPPPWTSPCEQPFASTVCCATASPVRGLPLICTDECPVGFAWCCTRSLPAPGVLAALRSMAIVDKLRAVAVPRWWPKWDELTV